MKNLINLAFILVLSILTGCATGEATRTSSTHYAETDPKSVQILFEKPSKKYEVIGFVSGEGAKLASQEAVFNAMREEAAKIGADAILMRSDLVETTEWMGLNARPKKQGSALAIKWVK